MRYPASEKLEIIRIVEQSHLPVRRTLDKPINDAIVPRYFQDISERCSEHIPSVDGRKLGVLQGLDILLPVPGRELSNVPVSEVPYQAPVVVVQHESGLSDVVGITLTRSS